MKYYGKYHKDSYCPLEDKLVVLTRELAITMLVRVNENPGRTKSETIQTGDERTKFIRLQDLEDFGLIRYVKKGEGFNQMELFITDKGKKILDHLSEIAEIMDRKSLVQ